MRLIIGFSLLLASMHGICQDEQLYWKNRKPVEGYWQQDVAYQINANLDDENDRITGSLALSYTNNSPDELDRLYFHLYQNMFAPNSYKNQFDDRHIDTADRYQKTEVSNLIVNGESVSFVLDNTIMMVELKAPIQSGETAEIKCAFTTEFGPKSGRMKTYTNYGLKHFNVVHWYPRISVYDRKFGWTTDQHLGHEFYGDFGTFDVELTLPAKYVLDGTGKLLNREQVLPADLMQKLRVENFKDKPWGEAPSALTTGLTGTKTWKFHADHVHDFAWTADPSYRIGYAVATLNNGHEVDCYSLVQEQHAAGWQNAAEYTAAVIELYSKDFGTYAYPKMIVADARDGMEYPMLTLDGGRDPYYRSLLAHEVGHNWFFGMVGNNETYRASLDEGFTQFLTSWAMENLEGDTIDWSPSERGIDRIFKEHRNTRDAQVYQGYYSASIARNDDPQLNTHSDHFSDRRGYGQVYYKTATMLFNLQYVLGDSLFLSAIQNYFDQWKFAHPYFEDFRNSMIQHTGVDLNWFFDQWLESDEHIDYAIRAFRKVEDGSYELSLERKGGMQMPVAISLESKEGEIIDYWIPNNDFIKETDARVLPKWVGWGENNPTYRVQLDSLPEIKSLQLDQSRRLADVYHLDNALPFPLTVEFDDLNYSYPIRSYFVEWHPSVWYNAYDGLKVGFEMKGDYYHTHHIFDFGFWYNTGIGQQSAELPDPSLENDFYRFNYRIAYRTPLRMISRKLDAFAESSFIDGLAKNKLGWEKTLPNGKTTVRQWIGSLYLPGVNALNYPLYGQLWKANAFNNIQQIEVNHRYRYASRSKGNVTSELRSPFLGSDYNYGYLNIASVNDNRTKRLNLRTRVFAQLGMGDNWAPESQLMAAGANAEEMSDNPFIRSIGFVPGSVGMYGAETGWFQSGGGLNLRGYNGYYMPEVNEDSLIRYTNAGSSGLAVNVEFEFDDMVKLWPKYKRWVELKTYVFMDAGIIDLAADDWQFGSMRADAGVGMALDIKQWGNWSDLRPTTVRLDFPLFLNRPPASEEFLQFRWLLAIDRAF